MYQPNLQTDYRQYQLDCERNHLESLSFPEWLTRRTDERLYEDRVYKQQPDAFKRVKSC